MFAKFGPSGNSQSFFDEGYTSTLDTFKWESQRGLELFEYSLGRGITIGSAAAEVFGAEAAKYGIEISVHAPYFINFASDDPMKAEKSIGYIMSSFKILRAFGGKRCVFHVGTEGKRNRSEAFSDIKRMFDRLLEAKFEKGYDDLILCPETMGKLAQIGTVEEIAELCKMDSNLYPCVDFGHINARTGGSLKTEEDFQRIIDKFFDEIGEKKTKNMHVHFSKIEFGDKGEKRHLTFEDTIFGPEFEPFANVIVKNNLTPHILSESAGTQAEDALYMKTIYNEILKQK